MCYSSIRKAWLKSKVIGAAAGADDLSGQQASDEEGFMQSMPSRRRVVATLSSATAAGLIGGAKALTQEAPPETTTIRLVKIPGICVAPQYVAEELLRTEGFTDIQYFESPGSNPYPGVPIVLLGGVHAGCFELFGTERVKAIRDLRGKTVAVPELGAPTMSLSPPWRPMWASTRS